MPLFREILGSRGLRRACATVLCALALGVRPAPAAGPQPVRAVWAHASSTRTPAECDRLIQDVQAAHLNCIYWLGFYWGGKCFFRTPHASMPSSVQPGFDPLAYLIEKGHAKGVEVHLRFVNGENGSREPGPFFSAHPDWALVNSKGERRLWYDFANPEVRRFQTDLMLGALRDYPGLDGVQFDFVRYDDGEGSFSDAALRGFAETLGIGWSAESPASLPLLTSLRGNPVGGETTAEVLARFGNGAPAVVGNNHGAGGALLLNWHAEAGPRAFVSTFLTRVIRAARHSGPIPAVNFPENAQWHAKYKTACERMVSGAGCSVTWTSPDHLGAPAATPLALVPNAYKISPAHAEALAAYAEAGGWLLFIDGPTFSMDSPTLQKLLGLSRSLDCLGGVEAIVPVDYETSLFDAGARVSPEQLKACRATGPAWRRYQADCVTQLVAEVHAGAKRIDPRAVVSACVFHRRSSAESLFQNWHDWVRAGIVDQAVTMAYIPQNDGLRQSMREWLATDPERARVIPGLGIYDIDDDGRSQSPAQVLEQMRICREEGGYASMAFFAHPNLRPELNQALTTGPFPSLAPLAPRRSR